MNKLSVVTISYNNITGLEKTLSSVRKQIQKGACIEYIVIDGMSDDGSIDLLNKNEDIINIKIIEHDTGIYNAMNKGLNIATGDSIVFLNSGDVFYQGFNLAYFQRSHSLAESNYFTRTIQYYEDVAFIRPRITQKKLIYSDYGHQGVFIPRKNYSQVKYDETKKIESDSIWLKKNVGNRS